MILKSKRHRVVSYLRSQRETIVDTIATKHLMLKCNSVFHIASAHADEGRCTAAHLLDDCLREFFFRIESVLQIFCIRQLTGKLYFLGFSTASCHKQHLCILVLTKNQIADEHTGGSKAENNSSVKDFFLGNLSRLCFVTFVFPHRHTEIVSTSEVFHTLQLEQHAGKWVREYHLLRKRKVQLSVFHIAVRNRKQHIRMEILLVTEQAVRLVTTVFKIGLFLSVSGRVIAVTATNQYNCKTVL